MYELLAAGLVNIAQVKYLLPLFFGTLAGVVGGALPGVTITMTIIVVLPFTFGLDTLQGLAAMTGVYVGGSAGGLVTAVLLGIPGTPAAIATVFDGHPMAKKGEPGRAIWLGVWASFFGGLLGGVFLIGATAPLAAIALQFGPWEFFSLFILAVSMVAGLTEASLLKGLIAGGLGLIVTVLGSDPVMGQERLTLGIDFVKGGIDFLPVLIGVFAFAQIMGEIERSGGKGQLARHHHGVRHSRRLGDRGHARRAHDSRHPVGAAFHFAESAARVRHFRRLPARASDHGADPRARRALDAAHRDAAESGAFPRGPGAVRDRRLRPEQHHGQCLCAAGVRRARLPDGEVRLSARAVHPGRDPRRPDRDQPGAIDHDRFQSLAVHHAADFRGPAARLGSFRSVRAVAASSNAEKDRRGGWRLGLLGELHEKPRSGCGKRAARPSRLSPRRRRARGGHDGLHAGGAGQRRAAGR